MFQTLCLERENVRENITDRSCTSYRPQTDHFDVNNKYTMNI